MAALTADLTVFQRGPKLVHIIREPEQTINGITRPAGSPYIVELPSPMLRERLSAVARFQARDGRSGQNVPKHPPTWCIQAVATRGEWPGIRRLAGITDAPLMRQDGSILWQPGYDPATGLLYEPTVTVPRIPEHPTEDDIHQALAFLLEAIRDFPFAKPEHQATAIAAVLTPLARHAFDGPAPLFLVDANTAGSGKGLFVDVVALTSTGRTIPIMSQPEHDAEFRKRITSLAIGGDPLIGIDNITQALGGGSLDAALTSITWRDRLLGKNEATTELPLRATWFATGNNVVLIGDTTRRTAHIRLDTRHENPEERTGFLHPNLRAWTLGNRDRMLAAALTILRGYVAAGRPDMQLRPWGSYEAWSDLIRNTVVWCELPDPGQTRLELRENADQDATALPAIIAGLEALDPTGEGLTVGDIIQKSSQYQDIEAVKALREAIIMTCKTRGKDFPSTDSIGTKFRHLKGKVVCGGKTLQRTEGRYATWHVQTVETKA